MNRFYILLMAVLLNVQSRIFPSEKQNYVMWEKLTEDSQKILSDIFDKEQFDNLHISVPCEGKGQLICNKIRPQLLVTLSPINGQSLDQQYCVSPICRHIVIEGNKIVNRY